MAGTYEGEKLQQVIKLKESKNDTKQLFNLISNITMSKTANPMLEGKLDEQLAEEFDSFFFSQE